MTQTEVKTRQPIILITGANGEVGHGLIRYLAEQQDSPRVVVLDLHPLDELLRPFVLHAIEGDILDRALIQQIAQDYEIDTIYHLAALLSTYGEHHPERAHAVNVEGTLNLLHMASEESAANHKPVKFIYPSSIAAYGIPDLKTKTQAGRIDEDHFLNPITMYGCNKLYCEHLGRYYSTHYKQLDETAPIRIDFRGVRFPGLISAFTIPSGGTSDFAPEMIHAAVQGHAYECFVRPDTMIPFMTMPDAIRALIMLAEAPAENLSRQVYNITGFSASAQDFADLIASNFPNNLIRFVPSAGRQTILDSWPADLNDENARTDWSWQPLHDFNTGFAEYLLPNIKEHYHKA